MNTRKKQSCVSPSDVYGVKQSLHRSDTDLPHYYGVLNSFVFPMCEEGPNLTGSVLASYRQEVYGCRWTSELITPL